MAKNQLPQTLTRTVLKIWQDGTISASEKTELTNVLKQRGDSQASAQQKADDVIAALKDHQIDAQDSFEHFGAAQKAELVQTLQSLNPDLYEIRAKLFQKQHKTLTPEQRLALAKSQITELEKQVEPSAEKVLEIFDLLVLITPSQTSIGNQKVINNLPDQALLDRLMKVLKKVPVEEAINTLGSHSFFKQALALTEQYRLRFDGPMDGQRFTKFYFEGTDHTTAAVQHYINQDSIRAKGWETYQRSHNQTQPQQLSVKLYPAILYTRAYAAFLNSYLKPPQTKVYPNDVFGKLLKAVDQPSYSTYFRDQIWISLKEDFKHRYPANTEGERLKRIYNDSNQEPKMRALAWSVLYENSTGDARKPYEDFYHRFVTRWSQSSNPDTLKQARAQGKVTLYDVGADHCPPCHKSKAGLLALALKNQNLMIVELWMEGIEQAPSKSITQLLPQNVQDCLRRAGSMLPFVFLDSPNTIQPLFVPGFAEISDALARRQKK